MNDNERIEYRGFWFHPDTPQVVRDIITNNYYNGRSERLRFIYGETSTGMAWLTETDRNAYGGRCSGAEGYIGRSTGRVKIPLEICNVRSMGGAALLDHCVIRIETARGGRVLYTHPKFHYKPEEKAA